MLDNYDSFTYNVVHLLRELGVTDLTVARNDKIPLEKVAEFDKIVLSPGPGIPLEAGIMPDIVREYGPKKSILGICLGHQCIGEVYGGTLINMGYPVHGKGVQAIVTDKNERIFKGVPERLIVGRYHSWLVDRKGFPDCLAVTATDEKGDIMALRHKKFDLCGVQFHPESVLTEHGAKMMGNWLRR